MTVNDWLGTLGVSLLLLAFGLNLFGVWHHTSRAYQGLNFLGACVLALVAWRMQFVPFLVLEGVWAAVSLLTFFRILRPSK